MSDQTQQSSTTPTGAASRAEGANLTGVLCRKPKTALGAVLLEARSKYIESGGKLLSADEINAERHNA